MWIKICANTTLEDAQMAVELGADAVGFVFAPSVRQVTPEQVAEITAQLPETVERIGVFPDMTAEKIAEIVRRSGLTGAQLHGQMDMDVICELRARLGPGRRVIPVISWKVDAGVEAADGVRDQLREMDAEGKVEQVLVDSKVGGATGGTGVAFDWEQASGVLRRPGGRLKLIVAGGLRPENVAGAIATLAPWGVDVASGVESKPGKKSPEKLAEFLRVARLVSARAG